MSNDGVVRSPVEGIMAPYGNNFNEKSLGVPDEKSAFKQVDTESNEDSDSDGMVLRNERDIATHIITVHDDETLNPWTFRAFLLGIGLSAFGGVLGTPHISISCHMS
jgi:hypothetical protein